MFANTDTAVVQLIIFFVFGIVCALIANNRGRNAAGWFFIGLLAPCLGIILLLVMPNLKIEEERQKAQREENRRLRERIRKDRLVADQRHENLQTRLGVHDEALGIDTSREIAPTPGPERVTEGGDPPPRPAAAPQKKDWQYMSDDGQSHGPLSAGEVKDLWRRRMIGPDTLVKKAGMANWAAIRELPGMEDLLNA